jgi:hypothetical protein
MAPSTSLLCAVALLLGGSNVRALQYGDDNFDSIAPDDDKDVNQPDAIQEPSIRTYGPSVVQPAMAYFHHWSKGKVASLLSIPRTKQVSLTPKAKSLIQSVAEPHNKLKPHNKAKTTQVQKAGVSAGSWASYLLAKEAQKKGCASQPETDLREWDVHEERVTHNEVKHTIFVSPTGQLQYLSEKGGRLLVADPPACGKQALPQSMLLERGSDDPPAKGGKTANLEEKDDKCSALKKAGECESNKEWMDEECPKSCDAAEGSSSKSSASEDDKGSDANDEKGDKKAKSEDPEDKDKKPCDCRANWPYLKNQYENCAFIEFDDKAWCYAVDADECKKAQESIQEGEKRKWVDCKLPADDKTKAAATGGALGAGATGPGKNKSKKMMPNKTGPVPNKVPSGGSPEHLDPATDPMAQDCLKLLERTTEENCGVVECKTKILSAQLSAVDGMMVTLALAVTGVTGDVHFHQIKCAFELQTNHSTLDKSGKNASLLETSPPMHGKKDHKNKAAPAPAPKPPVGLPADDSKKPVKTKCEKDTNMSCMVDPCGADLGQAECKGSYLKKKCTCKPGFCVKDGKCHKDHTKDALKSNRTFLDGRGSTDDDVIAEENKTELEKKGMHATLVMLINVCDLDKKNSVPPRPNITLRNASNFSKSNYSGPTNSHKTHRYKESADGPDSLMVEEWLHALTEIHRGEVSLYKGFEHYNDRIPRVNVPKEFSGRSTPPAEYDLRTSYPKCFPLAGEEVVRDQGNCGSCWAFASATTTMTNLCISGIGVDPTAVEADENDRYEVSTQNLMSCNVNSAGCLGGSSVDADDSMRAYGITRERNSPYQCGGGNPLDHFAASGMSCEAAPWGGQCDGGGSATPEWNYGGNVMVAGELAMLEVVSSGYALYVAIDCWSDFMLLPPDAPVYVGPGADATNSGGHAVTVVGYGVDSASSGLKFWTVQNSWNIAWASNGYTRVQRGENTIKIEELATHYRAWVTGGDVPACIDGATAGVQLGDGSNILCSQAASGELGDLCTQFPVVANNCPVACNSCIGRAAGDFGTLVAGGEGGVSQGAVPDEGGVDHTQCIEGTITGGGGNQNLEEQYLSTGDTDAETCNFYNNCDYPLNCECYNSGAEVYGAPVGGPYAIPGPDGVSSLMDFCWPGYCTCTRG